MEQRAVIDFCWHLRQSSMETNDLIHQAYSTEAMTQLEVFKCHKEFCDVQITTENAKDSGGPRTVRTEIMVNRLATLISTDHSLTV